MLHTRPHRHLTSGEIVVKCLSNKKNNESWPRYSSIFEILWADCYVITGCHRGKGTSKAAGQSYRPIKKSSHIPKVFVWICLKKHRQTCLFSLNHETIFWKSVGLWLDSNGHFRLIGPVFFFITYSLLIPLATKLFFSL